MNRMHFYPALSPLRHLQWANSSVPTQEAVDFIPSADIAQTNDAYVVWVALPGVDKKDVQIALENDELIVSGKTQDRLAKGESLVRSGIGTGTFKKVFTVSDGVDHEGIMAEYEAGLLKLTLPKAPTAQKRSINIV